MFEHSLEWSGETKSWTALTERVNNVLSLFSLSILYLLLPLSALNFVVHYRVSGNAASKMFLIDGSEAKIQGLLQCLASFGIAVFWDCFQSVSSYSRLETRLLPVVQEFNADRRAAADQQHAWKKRYSETDSQQQGPGGLGLQVVTSTCQSGLGVG